jgi:predicted PurR-regulated permease PerM
MARTSRIREVKPQGTSELPFSVRVISSPASPLQVFGGMFGTLLEVLGTAGIVIVLVVFFLIRREDLRDRFIHLWERSSDRDHADAGRRRHAGQPLPLDAVRHQCHVGIAVGIGLT